MSKTNFSKIDTTEIIAKAHTLWKNYCMDVYYDFKNNKLDYVMYDISNKAQHRQLLIDNVNMYKAFIDTLYHNTHINDRILKNMIADKLFKHIFQSEVDLSDYQTTLFSFHDTDTVVLDTNNTEITKGSIFTYDNFKQITTTDSRTHGNYGDAYTNIFSLTDDGDITLEEFDLYSSIICSNDVNTHVRVLDENNEEENSYCLFQFNDNGQITLADNANQNDYKTFVHINNDTIKLNSYNIYNTLFKIASDSSIEVLHNTNQKEDYSQCCFAFDEYGQLTLIDDSTFTTNHKLQEYIDLNNDDDITSDEWKIKNFILTFSSEDTVVNEITDTNSISKYSTLALDDNGDITLADINNVTDLNNNNYFVLDNELNLTTIAK